LRALADAVDFERFCDRCPNTHARVQGAEGVLKHNLHIPPQLPQLRRLQPQHIAPLKPDLAAHGRYQPQQCPTQGGFAAARLTHQAKGFALSNLE
jgi:hypothetical protein